MRFFIWFLCIGIAIPSALIPSYQRYRTVKTSIQSLFGLDVDWDNEYNLLLEYNPRDDYYYLSNSYGYNDTMLHLTDGTKGYWDWFDDGNNQFDDGSNVLLQAHDLSSYEAQTLKTAYPEGGWIGLCGSRFPSKVQGVWIVGFRFAIAVAHWEI